MSPCISNERKYSVVEEHRSEDKKPELQTKILDITDALKATESTKLNRSFILDIRLILQIIEILQWH